MDQSLTLLPLFSLGLELLFYVMTIIFVFFTLFMVYHWFTYGLEKATNMLALLIFLLGSAPLFLVMSLSLNAL